MKKIYLISFIFLTLFSLNVNAWFIFIPGSVTRAIGDAITGAKGDICVKDSYKVGDVITSPQTGNTAKILSLSGTSSICPNPATPIRADVEFNFNFSSKVIFELSDEYEIQPMKNLERFNGRLLFARSKSVAGKEILIFSNLKTETSDIQQMANNMERNQIAILKEGVSKNSERLNINGFDALRFEVIGTKKGVFGQDVTFLITLINVGSEIIVINQYAPTNIYADSKAEFVLIANSTKNISSELSVITSHSADSKLTPSSQASSMPNQPLQSENNSVKKLELLNDLLKKGLINQKDYEAKKAEILKSM
jgi:hypothetical protein